MKILLVEDEVALSNTLKEVLCLSSYEVDTAFNGVEAISYVSRYSYDLIIMDIMMPILDGISALKKIRANKINTPVILLSAKSELDDKVEGLDAGADDYLTKPFQVKELLARIRALLRRKEDIADDETFGNMHIDANSYTISNDNLSAHLTRKEFQLLIYLLRNQNKFVSSEKIFTDVWDSDTEAYITVVWVFISTLRKKFKNINANVEIEASRGEGYKIKLV